MAIDTSSIDTMISQLRATSSLAQAKPAETGAAEAGGVDFAQVLQNTMDQVSQAQQSAHKMTEDFASGQEGVNLQDVMINMQKASLSFQQMTQVRNKLVSAYNDIMNLQV